jgi:hypothetical protein
MGAFGRIDYKRHDKEFIVLSPDIVGENIEMNSDLLSKNIVIKNISICT